MRCLTTPTGDVRRAGLVEYAIEAWGLGTFMVSACLFDVLFEHPASPVRNRLEPLSRRALMGFAMGVTALGILSSPWGKRSGAHINPAVTLTFLRLGRIRPKDATFYALSQFVGSVLGVVLAHLVAGAALENPSTRFAVTKPGAPGTVVAFMAEVFISGMLMLSVLVISSSRYQAYAGLVAASLVALFITFEAPLSGMSINPARTLGSAIVAGEYEAIWIYFVAPVLGMLAAAEIFCRRGSLRLRTS